MSSGFRFSNLALRKRNVGLLGFVLTANPVAVASVRVRENSDMSAAQGDGSQRANKYNTNGLLLYYSQYSFYSQKVVMALHEKKLPFESHIINLIKGQQYEPWFLQLNPKGEVPVLQDTGKIIPDSTRIIDYLEDNFSNGDTPRLIPLDQGLEIRQRVMSYRALIEQLPAGVITMGSFFHPELVGKPKAPFFGPVRRLLANSERNKSRTLRQHAEKNPEARDILLQKARTQEQNFLHAIDKDMYLKVLQKVDAVLADIEQQLSKNSEDMQLWLCSDRFTIADIELTILLERLNQLGLESRFWSYGKRPFIEKYYERVKQRGSYKKTIPSLFVLVKLLFTQSPIYAGIGVFTAVAVFVGGLFVVKKIIF